MRDDARNNGEHKLEDAVHKSRNTRSTSSRLTPHILHPKVVFFPPTTNQREELRTMEFEIHPNGFIGCRAFVDTMEINKKTKKQKSKPKSFVWGEGKSHPGYRLNRH